MRRLSITAAAAFTAIVMAVSILPSPSRAGAVSGSTWRAGNIISDSIFTDTNSMSVSEIQNFLNGLTPNCDTSGARPATEWGRSDLTHAQYAAMRGWPAPPYICLKDYYEVPKTAPGPNVPANNFSGSIPAGSISASQIIYNAAKQYGISPKVLLVIIQKESSGPLTTDTWPLQRQYTYATGAHCPDSGQGGGANCDPNYAGFSIQIAESANLLHWYLEGMNQAWWPYKKPYQVNSILWNVSSTGCGSGDVYIQNKATAALYTYTPYQPNAAAIANIYGTGDRCSAYGNRNFWRIFSDWFGTTGSYYGKVPSNLTVNAKSPCNIYYFDNSTVMRLFNPDIQDYIFTTSYYEACRLVSYGYIWDGAAFLSATGDERLPVFRMGTSTSHIFTADEAEKATALQKGYKEEGVAYYVYAAPSQNRTPIYRVKNGPTQLLTSAGKEVEYFQNKFGYSSDGIVAYTPLQSSTVSTVYRMSRNNQRLYSPYQTELDNAARYGYMDEGSIALVDLYPNTGNLPVYRIRTPAGIFLYTTDKIERDIAITHYDCTAEGIPFYSLMWSDKPVNRASNPYNGYRVYTSDQTEYLDAQRYQYTPEGPAWYSY